MCTYIAEIKYHSLLLHQVDITNDLSEISQNACLPRDKVDHGVD